MKETLTSLKSPFVELDFPEWDDHSRPSYLWAAELVVLMNETEVYNDWCENLTSRGLMLLYLMETVGRNFCLNCAQQIGLLEECYKTSLKQRCASGTFFTFAI